MGEEVVEGIVEDAGSDEGVDVADSETVSAVSNFALEVLGMVVDLQMLAADGDLSGALACYDNVVDEAGKWGNAADREGGNGTPVGAELGRVAVDAVEVVHVGDGHVTASDDVVAKENNGLVDIDLGIKGRGNSLANENGGHRSQEDGVTTEESKEGCGRCEDFPL